MTAVYEFTDARTVIYAWLARSHIYTGHTSEALRILDSSEKTREVSFFCAEAYTFQKDWTKALEFVERALERPITTV